MAGADDKEIVIIELGSTYTKIGISGKIDTFIIQRTIVGHPLYQSMFDTYEDQLKFGNEAYNLRGVFKQIKPLEFGKINKWDQLEAYLKHIITSILKDDPGKVKLIFITQPNFEESQRLKDILLMNPKISEISLQVSGVMTSIFYGRKTGVVVDLGDTSISIIPMYQGNVFNNACRHLKFGGRDISKYLKKLFLDRGYTFGHLNLNIFDEIKKEICFIELNYDETINSEEKMRNISTTYNLPDGNEVHFSFERIKAPEVLFNPNLIGLECTNIIIAINDAIQGCDEHIQEILYQNIMLCGGTSLISGLRERIEKDIENLNLGKVTVKVHTRENMNNATWIGAEMVLNNETGITVDWSNVGDVE
ncbi:MAG: hypothetical protein OEZ01_04990 [Candidatus Heimdallarchaeota archaeon]|nr:hypothetical protein [Candidatus Heimdallarchaeota archaeon]MDH5645338.1 hypothetical protein [Candidatus Heimdallarchaeota archaeon]